MSLRDWQVQLHTHFGHLCRRRPSGRPVFALEHGLDAEQVEELHSDIRAHVLRSDPSGDHWLAWVVYASELGYRYAGEEYWQTFDELTPGWTGSFRPWLRDWFEQFADRFRGARPSGPWARHFSIICWPITHAILPQDLQRQLARILYELRHSFRPEHFQSTELLGKQIASVSYDTSSRFQNFAQEPVLVGQIAAALLLRDEELSDALLLPETLQRIVGDLNEERNAREWLRKAQEGVGPARIQPHRQSSEIRQKEHSQSACQMLGVEPQVVLRPLAVDAWDVVLEVPDLAPLLRRFPDFRPYLVESRCAVAGSDGRPLARESCLHGKQRVKLRSWPDQGQPLLTFESSSPELDFLLANSFVLRPGSTWLFKVASDGCAYEVQSRVVRPGCNYVLLSAGVSPLPQDSETLTVNCTGVRGFALEIPAAVDQKWQALLSQLRIQIAGKIRTWPSGLPSANPSDDCFYEWLIGDVPCIGISVDYAVEEIKCILDGSQEILASPVRSGESLFVGMPDLAPGTHEVVVSARAPGLPGGEQSARVLMRLREPRVWRADGARSGSLSVVVDPLRASLEELWEGAASISVYGPIGQRVVCSVALLGKPNSEPLLTCQLPPLRLPCDGRMWRSQFEQHVIERSDAQQAYDYARLCRLIFSLGDFGASAVECERLFTPVRWAASSKKDTWQVTLLNDTANLVLETEFYSYDHPDRCTAGKAGASDRIDVPVTGGMFVAYDGADRTGIVIPPMIRTLADLAVKPKPGTPRRAPTEIINTLDLIELWSSARVPGNPMAPIMRRRVIVSISRAMVGAICGKRWEHAEWQVDNESYTPESVRKLDQAAVDRDEQSLMHDMLLTAEHMIGMDYRKRIAEFDKTAQRYLRFPEARNRRHQRDDAPRVISVRDPENRRWLSEFALRVAGNPDKVREWSGTHLMLGLSHLLDLPALLRAARLVVFAIHSGAQADWSDKRELYSGWDWRWE